MNSCCILAYATWPSPACTRSHAELMCMTCQTALLAKKMIHQRNPGLARFHVDNHMLEQHQQEYPRYTTTKACTCTNSPVATWLHQISSVVFAISWFGGQVFVQGWHWALCSPKQHWKLNSLPSGRRTWSAAPQQSASPVEGPAPGTDCSIKCNVADLPGMSPTAHHCRLANIKLEHMVVVMSA